MDGNHPVRLGRLPHHAAALAAAPRRYSTVPPPPVLDRSKHDFQPGLWGNDTYPNCTAVALANAALGAAQINGYGLVIDPKAPLAFYADCVGNPPDLAATGGAVMLDVLTRAQTSGYNIGPQLLVPAFGVVPLALSALAASMAHEPLYCGVTLLERDMDTRGSLWDVQDGRDDGAVVGGHAVMLWDYRGLELGDTVRIGTWGGWQPATWRWVMARLDEAFGMAWRQIGVTT